eukprot:COSAG06_NODE_7426_length_2509_cov_2.290456_2_plen_61_part_00
MQVTLIIDQTIDTIVTSSSPLAVSKATCFDTEFTIVSLQKGAESDRHIKNKTSSFELKAA